MTTIYPKLNTTPTRGSNVLDLVITSVPELVSVTEILTPGKSEIITDHSAIIHEFLRLCEGSGKGTKICLQL